MKNKFTILGCGSSLGSPWITNHWGKLNKKDKKNIRTRCCAHIFYQNISILIDTSPDIKEQIRKNKIKNIDAVIYTHEHADQIPVYGSKRTTELLKQKYTFCFSPRSGYKPIMSSNIFNEQFTIRKNNKMLKIRAIELQHGMIKANGFIFKKIAYLSDCNKIPKKSFNLLKNLDYLVIDCLRKNPHPSHFHFDETIRIAKKLSAKKTILTNLHVDLDYLNLKKKLPKNIIPAYDGLSFNF